MFSNLPMLAILRGVRKQKAFDKDSEIACHIVEGQEGKEISLAENEMRMAMHPADQFEAFKSLADEGKEPRTSPPGSASRRRSYVSASSSPASAPSSCKSIATAR
jgi:hypothetical protein